MMNTFQSSTDSGGLISKKESAVISIAAIRLIFSLHLTISKSQF